MPWNTAVNDLRTLLSDGPTDKYSFRKKCFGEVNGTNLMFKTFEFRRITNFTTSVLPLGVYVDGIIVPASGLASDYPDTGEFFFASATGSIPQNGSVVEASYYIQWFLDSELTDFLGVASNWLINTVDFTQVIQGLQPSALKYAAAEAYLKMSMKWKIFYSEMYKVEDEPKKPGFGPSDAYYKMSEVFREEALKSRDEYYTRQGRSLQPLFGSVLGNIRPMPSPQSSS